MEELRRSYKSGITSIILIVVFFVLLFSLFFIDNSIVVLSINIISFIVLVLALAFYFKMMVGYIHIGEKYSKSLKKATYGVLICIVIMLLLMVLLYFASVEGSMIFINAFALLLLITYFVFAILKIVSGVSIYRAPVKSNTKNTLSIFSILYGISMILVVPNVFLPYIKTMEMIFEILFLKDTYQKKHKRKTKRNLWFWIGGLVIYLIFASVIGYFFYNTFLILFRMI